MLFTDAFCASVAPALVSSFGVVLERKFHRYVPGQLAPLSVVNADSSHFGGEAAAPSGVVATPASPTVTLPAASVVTTSVWLPPSARSTLSATAPAVAVR